MKGRSNTRAVARKNAIKKGGDPLTVMDCVMVDPEFDELDQVDLEEVVGRGGMRGSEGYE